MKSQTTKFKLKKPSGRYGEPTVPPVFEGHRPIAGREKKAVT